MSASAVKAPMSANVAVAHCALTSAPSRPTATATLLTDSRASAATHRCSSRNASAIEVSAPLTASTWPKRKRFATVAASSSPDSIGHSSTALPQPPPPTACCPLALATSSWRSVESRRSGARFASSVRATEPSETPAYSTTHNSRRAASVRSSRRSSTSATFSTSTPPPLPPRHRLRRRSAMPSAAAAAATASPSLSSAAAFASAFAHTASSFEPAIACSQPRAPSSAAGSGRRSWRVPPLKRRARARGRRLGGEVVRAEAEE